MSTQIEHTQDQRIIILESAFRITQETGSEKLFLFLNTNEDCNWFLGTGFLKDRRTVFVIPKGLEVGESDLQGAGISIIRSWSGNQSRFSRIKYAFLNGVLQGIIKTDSKVVCVLGPWGRRHLDTISVIDLAHSWSREFPFDPMSIITKKSLDVIMAVIDIALEIGALGREGHPIGTTFIIGDTKNVMQHSHQTVFNPFKGYPKHERSIVRQDVVESIKELAKLDGAFIISDTGVVEAAGRHLDARSIMTKELRGFGSRHRAAAGITRMTKAIGIVVSESDGRVTVFEKGNFISFLEPVISRRLV
jgi:diadenylate cyclase